MEASFCLSPHPFLLLKSPSLPLTHSSYRINSSLTAKHYHVNSFHRFSLSIDNGSTSMRSNVLLPITCHAAFDGVPIPHKKDERKNTYQNLVTTVGATVILTCALGMIMCSSDAKAIIPSSIQKLMIMNQMDSSSQGGGGGGGGGKKDTQRAKISEIKKKANDFADKGDLEEAEKYLKAKYDTYKKEEEEKVKEEENKNLIHEEAKYLIDILLIEMLIRQGKYEEALGRKCLSEFHQPEDVLLSDIRIYLYKTYLYAMVGNHKQARVWFEALLESAWINTLSQGKRC